MSSDGKGWEPVLPAPPLDSWRESDFCSGVQGCWFLQGVNVLDFFMKATVRAGV